jgi:hypothetical protein
MLTYRKFCEQYRLAYQHKGGIKAKALGRIDPAWFAEIQKEVAWIIDGQPSSNVGDKTHTTYWTQPKGVARQFSLFNATGKSDEYLTDFAPSTKVSKKLTFPNLTAIARFAALFGNDLVNLRLNGLGASSGLSLHEENPISATRFGRKYRVRFHLPIHTNPSARMLLDGEEFHFDVGNLYFFHHGCVHAAINDADSHRYHFVLDCELSPELYAKLFTGLDAAPGFIPFTEAKSAQLSKGTAIEFGEFVTQEGKKITGIDYGRRVPGMLDWYRTNYPSLFNPIDRLLQASA